MDDNRIILSGTWRRSIGGRQIDFVPVPGSYAPVGQCELEFEFECPWPARDGSRLLLCTEGVLAGATFELNGLEVGTAGPWARYRFELPDGLLKVRNVLRARVRDIVEDFGPAPGRRFDGGLVREIYIDRRPPAFLDSMAFRAALDDGFTSADCTVAVKIDGPADQPVRIVLAERDTGRVVAEAQATRDTPARFGVDFPRLWSPEFPNLYVLTAALGGQRPDVLRENVGFRRIDVRGQDFYLNGRRLLLKGVCRHEFTDANGYSPTKAEVNRELSMIRHAGFNYVRLVHSPQAACVCRTAAEVGLLVSEEPGTCFHDLASKAIAAPALECLRRTVLRDRNVPSIFAWLIYNECNPNIDYAVQAAKDCRRLDPGCLLSFADCSGKHDEVKAMAAAADLAFYGINVYSQRPNDYCERMKTFTDRPILFTEWGGCLGQGNARLLKDLCDTFVAHTRQDQSIRLAGVSFWAWADYEEHSRAEPASIDGWTIEGLVDAAGRPKADLQTLSNMCFEMGREPLRLEPRVEVLCPAPRRDEPWQPVRLEAIEGDQSALEAAVLEMRRTKHLRYAVHFNPVDPAAPLLPRFGRLLVDGIEFHCRDALAPAEPLMIGPSRREAVIPVGREVAAIAVLGHVAAQGGYPASRVWSVHHRDEEQPKSLGQPAAEYELVFDHGSEVEPLRHGMEVLRANDICRWWTPQPRAPHTRPAARAVISKSYEILRVDLWEKHFSQTRHLEAIRWRLVDDDAILLIWAVSVQSPPQR